MSDDLARRLTFDDVAVVNATRCSRWHPGFPDDEVWSIADWSNALAGETGEAANVVKKLRRHETGTATEGVDLPVEELRAMLADELADVFCYLDLLATKAGIDLPAAVISKFNRVSERQSFPDRLTDLSVANPLTRALDILEHVEPLLLIGTSAGGSDPTEWDRRATEALRDLDELREEVTASRADSTS